nr:MAG TPA: hypothetical protein [Caudoviricetes sp.]
MCFYESLRNALILFNDIKSQIRKIKIYLFCT